MALVVLISRRGKKLMLKWLSIAPLILLAGCSKSDVATAPPGAVGYAQPSNAAPSGGAQAGVRSRDAYGQPAYGQPGPAAPGAPTAPTGSADRMAPPPATPIG